MKTTIKTIYYGLMQVSDIIITPLKRNPTFLKAISPGIAIGGFFGALISVIAFLVVIIPSLQFTPAAYTWAALFTISSMSTLAAGRYADFPNLLSMDYTEFRKITDKLEAIYKEKLFNNLTKPRNAEMFANILKEHQVIDMLTTEVLARELIKYEEKDSFKNKLIIEATKIAFTRTTATMLEYNLVSENETYFFIWRTEKYHSLMRSLILLDILPEKVYFDQPNDEYILVFKNQNDVLLTKLSSSADPGYHCDIKSDKILDFVNILKSN